MEFHPSCTLVAITFFVIIAAFASRKRAKRAKKIRKPPQAKGAWPLTGYLHLLGGSRLPHHVLGDMADKYGPVFTIKLGVHHALVVTDPQIAKDCFTTNDKVFASRPKAVATELMGYNYGIFGFAPYGDYWRQVRKITVLEFLSQRRVEMLQHIRVSEVEASIKDLYDAWVKNKESTNSDMVKVEMSQWFGNLVLNIVVRAITGKRFSATDEEGVHFQVVVRKFFELMGAFVVSDYLPYLKCLDVGGYNRAMKKTARDLDNILEGWLKIERESTQQPEGNSVFIRALISILEGAAADDFSGFDHDTIIKATCQQMLVAGLDTSSVTLTWTLSLLLNSPNALKLGQDEIDEHVGRDRLVESSDIKNLVYLDAVIKETLRLYPAGPLSVPHESMEDCIAGGFSIPKGTRLLVNLWKC